MKNWLIEYFEWIYAGILLAIIVYYIVLVAYIFYFLIKGV